VIFNDKKFDSVQHCNKQASKPAGEFDYYIVLSLLLPLAVFFLSRLFILLLPHTKEFSNLLSEIGILINPVLNLEEEIHQVQRSKERKNRNRGRLSSSLRLV